MSHQFSTLNIDPKGKNKNSSGKWEGEGESD